MAMRVNMKISLIVSVVLCGLFVSCDKDDSEVPISDDEKVISYYYREKGFFMNGEIMAKGTFERDSIMTGYAKYVKVFVHYTAASGDEYERDIGYRLVVEMDNYAKFYSDDIICKVDSTHIECNGEFLPINESLPRTASIEAQIDSIGKPHLIICRTSFTGKQMTFQFRQTYYMDSYSDAEMPPLDEFDI